MAHGSCNFAPPKDLKHDNDLLERKRRDREQQAADDSDDLSCDALPEDAFLPWTRKQNVSKHFRQVLITVPATQSEETSKY